MISKLLVILIISVISSVKLCSCLNSGSVCKIANLKENGICKKTDLCTAYQNFLSDTTVPIEEKHRVFKAIECNLESENKEEKFVCCPNNTNEHKFRYSLYETDYVSHGLSKRNIVDAKYVLFNKDDCGIQIQTRLIGAKIAELSDFPWMALLVYNNTNPATFGCGGTLINDRYVVTAAHCVWGKRSKELKKVRLGEYNTDYDGIDCIYDLSGTVISCADPAKDYPIEKILVHPNYKPDIEDHDIALIRLTDSVNFTEFIQPICVPTPDFDSGLRDGSNFTVSGWGKSNIFSEHVLVDSPIKLKLMVPYVDREECAKAFEQSNTMRHLNITMGQVCAGGIALQDSCQGDSGSPLMYYDGDKSRFVLSGIVSWGHSICGKEGVPGVYTNVQLYVPWLESNVKQ